MIGFEVENPAVFCSSEQPSTSVLEETTFDPPVPDTRRTLLIDEIASAAVSWCLNLIQPYQYVLKPRARNRVPVNRG
jgi:hypothetical protein